MKYINATLRKYLKHTAKRTPAPGGGSAAASTAAIGTSLLIMAAGYTLTNKFYKKSHRLIRGVVKELASAKREQERLIDDDIAAYLKVRKCLKLLDSKRKDIMLQKALKRACKSPLRVCEISSRMLKSAFILLRKGNKHLVSDVKCGAVLEVAAFSLGRINCEINLAHIKDKAFAQGVKKRIENMKKGIDILIKKF
ncbi:MAG: cyclodeaminase/cyclohydrolase family protein [Candidatus Omnitrophica bacterium]|nr:cyclodeaminase/cyclohydrolase family protein [Candidatus Omnitrophota bacterium]